MNNFSEEISIRKFKTEDFPLLQRLYNQEGWMTFINRPEEALKAWENSNPALVCTYGSKIIGLVRGLTDGEITTYIAEIIVDNEYRKKGIGKALLDECHNLYPHTRFDLLATEEADKFYRNNGFRSSTGFRRSFY